jgi:hypothetical protein
MYPISTSAPSMGRSVREPMKRNTRPTATGIPVARRPGSTISCSAAEVTRATQVR